MSDEFDPDNLGRGTDDLLGELGSLKDILDHELADTSDSELEALLNQELSDNNSWPPATESVPPPSPVKDSRDEEETETDIPVLPLSQAVEDEAVIPVLDEVVFDGNEATPTPLPDSHSTLSREELEALIEAILERELPRLREQIRQQLLTELESLLGKLRS